ncbi:DUF6506 family protein [Streptomyces sp. NPDC088729]|uniref:DUF6506 family protein n=1 Tax=Streptomyces sp. NPDC088729 TaxID=3365876 RepID=UPI0038251C59
MAVTWIYLFDHPGADPARDRVVLDSPSLRAVLVAVPEPADAVAIVKDLVAAEDAKLVEVCGAFTNEDVAKVAQAVGPDIPVGHSYFSQEAAPGILRFQDAYAQAVQATG